MKADAPSPQVKIETYPRDVLPRHPKVGNIADCAVDELERVKAQLHHAEAPKWT